MHQQQKNSSTDAETIIFQSQTIAELNVSQSVKERESRKENTVSHKQTTDQNEPQLEKTRGKP